MSYYGIFIYSLKHKNRSIIFPISCPEMKSQLYDLLTQTNEMYHILSPKLKENSQNLTDHLNTEIPNLYNVSRIYITIKSINYTKSKLGLNYNILNIFF
ncbi:hypothetical protein NEIRO03_2729 [Nematocida sp. AWRm78]|nr:hypothetical protein NEIRO03_2729 [Nematocida sp. AWRm78]